MLRSSALLFALSISTTAFSAQPRYCHNIVEAACGEVGNLKPLATLDDLHSVGGIQSEVEKGMQTYFNRCFKRSPLANLPEFTQVPSRWVMQHSAPGRELFQKLLFNSRGTISLFDMKEYDELYLHTNITGPQARDIIGELLPVLERFENQLVEPEKLGLFSNRVTFDMLLAIEQQSQVRPAAKEMLKARIEKTRLVSGSQFLREALGKSDEDVLSDLQGYYYSCRLDGGLVNAFNDGRFRVVLCPGLLMAGIMNGKEKKEQLIEPLILSSDRPARELSPEVEAMKLCGGEVDLDSLYVVLAHELGHSIDGSLLGQEEQGAARDMFVNRHACIQKKYPSVTSPEHDLLKDFGAYFGRNREVTADFWAGQALAQKLKTSVQPRYAVSGQLHDFRLNARIFCVQSLTAGSELEFEAEASGHLHGTKRVQALLDESPELYSVLGCEAPKNLKSCSF